VVVISPQPDDGVGLGAEFFDKNFIHVKHNFLG
jgi:hypothetical protein